MKRFRYLTDRLFLVSSLLYAVNRWLIKPQVHSPFLRFHFNDLLLLPCALPPLLFIQRRLGLRQHDRIPAVSEIVLYLILWSVLFEIVGPRLMPGTTGDLCDVAAYTGGAIVAGLWWHRERFIRQRPRHEL